MNIHSPLGLKETWADRLADRYWSLSENARAMLAGFALPVALGAFYIAINL
jgi:hypothetical protein